MLVAVKSCEKHWDRCSAIRETWGDDERVVFFTGNKLGVYDDYNSLPAKTQAICRWALARGHLWAFLCDTDTYVCLSRLKVPAVDYTGYLLPEGYCSGGAGYWLSRKAMEVVAHFDAKDYLFEDKMTGDALKEAGIEPVHDLRYSLYDDVLPGNDRITRHLSSRVPYQIEFMYAAHRRANDCGS